MHKRVLIIENSPQDCNSLRTYAKEAGGRKGLEVHVEPVVRNHLDEFKLYMDESFSSTPIWTDLMILDVMFKAKEGIKQADGGVELWKYMKSRGYSTQIGELLVVTNGEKAFDEFPRIEPTAKVIRKGDRSQVISAIEDLL